MHESVTCRSDTARVYEACGRPPGIGYKEREACPRAGGEKSRCRQQQPELHNFKWVGASCCDASHIPTAMPYTTAILQHTRKY